MEVNMSKMSPVKSFNKLVCLLNVNMCMVSKNYNPNGRGRREMSGAKHLNIYQLLEHGPSVWGRGGQSPRTMGVNSPVPRGANSPNYGEYEPAGDSLPNSSISFSAESFPRKESSSVSFMFSSLLFPSPSPASLSILVIVTFFFL